jgi:hypothetical protein
MGTVFPAALPASASGAPCLHGHGGDRFKWRRGRPLVAACALVKLDRILSLLLLPPPLLVEDTKTQ